MILKQWVETHQLDHHPISRMENRLETTNRWWLLATPILLLWQFQHHSYATSDILLVKLKLGCFFRTCSFSILLPGSPSGDRKPPTNRCCTAARSVLKRRKRLARTKLWTLQSSQLQNQTSINSELYNPVNCKIRHQSEIKTYQDISKPKVTNTSGRYQRMQSCTLHSAQNRCSSG